MNHRDAESRPAPTEHAASNRARARQARDDSWSDGRIAESLRAFLEGLPEGAAWSTSDLKTWAGNGTHTTPYHALVKRGTRMDDEWARAALGERALSRNPFRRMRDAWATDVSAAKALRAFLGTLPAGQEWNIGDFSRAKFAEARHIGRGGASAARIRAILGKEAEGALARNPLVTREKWTAGRTAEEMAAFLASRPEGPWRLTDLWRWDGGRGRRVAAAIWERGRPVTAKEIESSLDAAGMALLGKRPFRPKLDATPELIRDGLIVFLEEMPAGRSWGPYDLAKWKSPNGSPNPYAPLLKKCGGALTVDAVRAAIGERASLLLGRNPFRSRLRSAENGVREVA